MAKQIENKWDTEVPSVWQFQLLAAVNLGEYAGGADLKLGCPILVMKCNKKSIPKEIISKLPKLINNQIDINSKIPYDQRVARLPNKPLNEDEIINNWEYSCHFHIGTDVPLANGRTFNLMYQGWLFKDIPNDPNRRGCSLYPLIGIFKPYKMVKPLNDVAYAGFEDLTYSDQHCHLDFGAWHFGSDMSKIIVEHDAILSKFWAVCVDHDSKRINATLFYIVNPNFTNQIEGTIRTHNPHKSRKDCQAFYDFFTLILDDYMTDQMKEELKNVLFGPDKPSVKPQKIMKPVNDSMIGNIFHMNNLVYRVIRKCKKRYECKLLNHSKFPSKIWLQDNQLSLVDNIFECDTKMTDPKKGTVFDSGNIVYCVTEIISDNKLIKCIRLSDDDSFPDVIYLEKNQFNHVKQLKLTKKVFKMPDDKIYFILQEKQNMYECIRIFNHKAFPETIYLAQNQLNHVLMLK